MPRNVFHQISIKDAESLKTEDRNIGKVLWVITTLDCVNFLQYNEYP